MSVLLEKIKEVLFSVLPIMFIVLILHFTGISQLENHLIYKFILGGFSIIIGLSIFLAGVDIGISPIGELIGKYLTKTNKLWLIILIGLAIGFIISIAEPDLHILAQQVSSVSSGEISKNSIVIVVSIGISIMLTIGLIRILYEISLRKVLTISYGVVFILSCFVSSEFLAVAFDASGATTGAMTVPFILALSIGVATLKKNSNLSEEDSFGLVAITSIGAILGVLIMNILSNTKHITGVESETAEYSTSVLSPFIEKLPIISKEVVLALSPLLIIFIIFNQIFFKLKRRKYIKILKGLLYTLIGLILFLLGANAGFMEVGYEVGKIIASDNKVLVVVIGFILGFFVILAEPAVHVLTEQVENITSGYVSKKSVLGSLCIGVGLAVALSMVRIVVPAISLWHFLLPGYIIAIILSHIVPKLFVGMAFDSGGVASGAMTATFILAFSKGVAEATEGANVLVDGFGMISMVALTPLITLQLLGLIFKLNSKKGGTKENGF